MALQTSSPWLLASSLCSGLGACGDDTVDSATATATNSGKTSTGPSTGEPGSSTGSASQPTTTAGEGTVSDSGTTAGSSSGDPTVASTSEGPSTGTTAGVDAKTATATGSTDAGTGTGTTQGVVSTSSTPARTPRAARAARSSAARTAGATCGSPTASTWVSKLDTRMMTEVGRYYTRPDQQGSPSRTSVSIDGKAVVVANRHGGITKIWSRPEYCTNKNGNGKIDTSTGKNNVLPFNDDKCIAWYTAFPNATTQRPVAWTSGIYNEQNCEYEDQQI